jgi:hypothetical protein
MRAVEIVLRSLTRAVLVNAPEFSEQIKDSIEGAAEFVVPLRDLRTKYAGESFQKEIKQAILRFKLAE